jgi:translocation and assembly module TamB
VKLPNRTPRAIQPLDERDDIVVGPFKKKVPAPVATVAAAGRRPYHAKVHVLVPRQFFVKSDSPRVDVELKGDVTAEYDGTKVALVGDVETLRGQVEPFGGRSFDLKSTRVHFTGADYKTAVLEITAVHANPAANVANVTVAITGAINSPQIKLTSEPPMDEGQIALYLATGRTELKANSGGVGGINEQVTGAATAVASAYLVGEFKKLVADKLPVDSVAIDASQLRAGKYVTDKLYVGYTWRRNADPEKGENTNEVRLEYQITPRWTLEGRAGDAGSGGGSLIWSKDY